MPDFLPLQGEEQLLRQIFWNLARNALQAMPGGGELAISGEQRDGAVILRWRDSGVGMTEDVRRQAFEPFVTTRPGGTGLGLAVVYAAVAEHGGTVRVEENRPRGSVFIIELPLRRDAAPGTGRGNAG